MTEETNETDVPGPGLGDWWRLTNSADATDSKKAAEWKAHRRFTNSGRTVADKEKEAEAAFQQMRIARYLLSGGRGEFWLQDWSTYQPQA